MNNTSQTKSQQSDDQAVLKQLNSQVLPKSVVKQFMKTCTRTIETDLTKHKLRII